MARKASQAARRAVAKAKREACCEVAGCVGNSGKRTLLAPCCDFRVCDECVLKSLSVRLRKKHASFVYGCSICGEETPMPNVIVKELMCMCCPGHVQVMDQRSRGKVAVVAHVPCPSGRYACSRSSIEARKL